MGDELNQMLMLLTNVLSASIPTYIKEKLSSQHDFCGELGNKGRGVMDCGYFIACYTCINACRCWDMVLGIV